MKPSSDSESKNNSNAADSYTRESENESASQELNQTVSFEDSFAKIENIVKQLEQGTLGLEQSLAMYQAAVGHLRFCHKKLAQAHRKVEILQNVELDGTADCIPMDDEATELSDKIETRSRRRSTNSKKPPETRDLLP